MKNMDIPTNEVLEEKPTEEASTDGLYDNLGFSRGEVEGFKKLNPTVDLEKARQDIAMIKESQAEEAALESLYAESGLSKGQVDGLRKVNPKGDLEKAHEYIEMAKSTDDPYAESDLSAEQIKALKALNKDNDPRIAAEQIASMKFVNNTDGVKTKAFAKNMDVDTDSALNKFKKTFGKLFQN